jgi:CheY-like chemotaxis protein
VKQVLVIDDEVELLESIRAILEAEGYDVVAKSNGHEALEYLRTHRPDMVFTDVMMPLVSGYDILVAMNGNAVLAPIPKVLMSCVNPSVKQSTFKWDYFLRKPFSIEQLLDLITKFTEVKSEQKENEL